MSEKFLKDQEVAARYGVHRATVWRWVEAGQFPQPVRLSPAVTRWRLSDLEAHEAALDRGAA